MFPFFQKKAYFDFPKENKLVLDEIINYRPVTNILFVGKVIECGSLATPDSLGYLNSFQFKIMLRTTIKKKTNVLQFN